MAFGTTPSSPISFEPFLLKHGGRLILGPFPRTVGRALGNALRRAALSLLERASVTSVHFPDLPHEFSVLPGVVESPFEIALRLQQVRVAAEEKTTLKLRASGPGPVTAGALQGDATILNPEEPLATLSADGILRLEVGILRGWDALHQGGKGSLRRSFPSPRSHHGSISLSPRFTPVERMRVAVRPEGDRETVALEWTTDGSVSPLTALRASAQSLRGILAPLASYPGEGEEEGPGSQERGPSRLEGEAALRRATDDLEGMRENLIIGGLIPAGSGFRRAG